jgi:predicted ATPase
LGRTEEANRYFSEAAQVIETSEERWVEAELRRLRADSLACMGDQVAAEWNYHQALSIAKGQRAKLLELRAATSLARLWLDRGRRAEARDLLGPIYGWFAEGSETTVLQDAKALLDKLG